MFSVIMKAFTTVALSGTWFIGTNTLGHVSFEMLAITVVSTHNYLPFKQGPPACILLLTQPVFCS